MCILLKVKWHFPDTICVVSPGLKKKKKSHACFTIRISINWGAVLYAYFRYCPEPSLGPLCPNTCRNITFLSEKHAKNQGETINRVKKVMIQVFIKSHVESWMNHDYHTLLCWKAIPAVVCSVLVFIFIYIYIYDLECVERSVSGIVKALYVTKSWRKHFVGEV